MFVCTCRICNSEFEAAQRSTVICPTCRFRPCVVCGKSFKHTDPNQKCCSNECKKVLMQDPSHKAEALARRDATVKMRYGVANVSELSSVRSKISKSKTDKDNYFTEKEYNLKNKQTSTIIRVCTICGEEFVSTGNTKICSKQHLVPCKVCGKLFEIRSSCNKINRKTCSEKCRSELRKQNLNSTIRICQYCGKQFTSAGNTAKYCPGPHYKKCEFCGKDFEVSLLSGAGTDCLPKTCSAECRIKLSQQTCLDRYGVPFASQTAEARARAKEQSIENRSIREQTCLERYGYKHVGQVPEIRARISSTISSEQNQEKMKATVRERYGVDYVMQSSEFAKIHSGSQFKQVACDGTRVDSRWEALFYDFLVRNDIPFEYNTVSFPVEVDGVRRVTHIDFKVGDLLFEVKGSHLLEGAFSDTHGVIPIWKKIEVYKKNHVIVITDDTCHDMFGKPNSTESNGLKYLNKCPEPLIGVDIKLFDHPDFPFADDRPPCFYNVRVDGSMSSFDAFYNEQIRWKMILNRIQYSGGFIDAKQVLNAMNVTRTCKQPSWFSKSLAKRVIQTYCTSSTIVDPFAGWGTRCDAALECNRKYIGSDLNPELVAWHQSHSRNIVLCDANQFKYEDECSVFICPPYSDPETGRCFEDYNFDGFDQSAKSMSQCDWLKVVMNNVPNAREYVMVCKIVDSDFNQCIVETLSNNSHFGTNNEYILVVRK